MKKTYCASLTRLWCIIFVVAFSVRPAPGFCVRDSSFAPSGFASGATIFAIATQSDGKVVVGGSFTFNTTYPNGYPWVFNNLVRFNANGSLDTSFNPSPNSTVRAILIQPDDKIIIAGSFNQVSGMAQNSISRLTSSTGYPDYIGFNAPTPNHYVLALGRLSDGKVIIGGMFTTLNGASYSRVACLTTSGAIVSTFNPGVDGSVGCIAVYPAGMPSADKVLIGGTFTSVGGYTRLNVARLQSSGPIDTAFTGAASDMNGTVHAVAPDYGPFTTAGVGGSSVEKVYIGGSFTGLAGSRNYFTRLAANGGVDSNIEFLSVNGAVKSIRIQADHQILMAGSFSQVVGSTRNGVARLFPGQNGVMNDLLTLTDWSDCGGATGASVETLSEGGVYAGGSFTAFESVSAQQIVRMFSSP